jgi:hypothetical protein
VWRSTKYNDGVLVPMNYRQTGALAALMATVLVFASVNSAFAEPTKTDERDYSKETKHAKDEGKMKMEHEKKMADKMATKKTSTKNYSGTSETMTLLGAAKGMQNPNDALRTCSAIGPFTFSCKSVPKTDSFGGASVDITSVTKLRHGSPADGDATKVVYKVTAGDSNLRNVKVLVTSDSSTMENSIKNLFANRSTVHAVYINVGDPASVSVKLVR